MLFFLPVTAYSQVGGEYVFQFLNLSTSARQLALGGEVLTLTNDVNQPVWNPATINAEMDRQLAVNYTSYLAGINIGSASYAHVLNRRFGTLHTSVQYLNYGSLIEADENGNETGTFNASDLALSVGYAMNIPLSNFYLGANLKLINSSIANFNSTGVAIDLAVMYYSEFKPYSFTIVARNIGAQVSTFDETREDIPFKIAIGADYQLEHVPLKWYLTLDNLQQWDVSVPNPSNQTSDLEGNVTEESISFLNNALRHVVVGAELFPKSAVNLRIGYNYRRSQELKLQNARTFSGLSFGFGIKMNKIRFNYALSKYHSASDASTFSLMIDLDKRRR